MGRLGDRLDGIRLRARVPGTEISGELCNRKEISISFGSDSYPWLREPQLEGYLASLARLLCAGWQRESELALRDSFLDVDPPQDARSQGYERAREQLEASGSSADGRVTVSAVGLRNFTVHITPGTLRELAEHEFVARVREAATAFLADHMARIHDLKTEFFT